MEQQQETQNQNQEATATPANKRKRHRPYVKNACLHCNSSHLSCSNERPCARCVSRGIECVEKPVKSRKIGAQHPATTNFNIASQIIINANANPGMVPLQQLRPAPQAMPTQAAPIPQFLNPNFQQLQKLQQVQHAAPTMLPEIQDESLRARLLQIIVTNASNAVQRASTAATSVPAITSTAVSAATRPILPTTSMPSSVMPTNMSLPPRPFSVPASTTSLPITAPSTQHQTFVPPGTTYTPSFSLQPLASTPPPVTAPSSYMNLLASSTPAHATASAPAITSNNSNINNNNSLMSQIQSIQNVLQSFSTAAMKPPQQINSTDSNHSSGLLPLIPLNLEEEDPKPTAAEQTSTTTQQDQEENVMVNLPSFCVRMLDLAHSEMTAWHRKNFKLLHANSTFLNHYKLSRDNIGTFSFFDFDPRGLQPKPPHLRALFLTLLQPQEFGKEPFVKKYWHKFFIDDGESRKMITIHVMVEKDFFCFERSKTYVGKSGGNSEALKDAFIEEYQVNDLEVQRSPPTTDRIAKVLRIATYIETQRAIALAQLSHQFL